MTRQLTSSSPSRETIRSLLQPLGPTRSLSVGVAERIAAEIRNGQLAPGAQLPTEVALMAAMNVSRTVVREAVAALKADGLVVTRQGLGAFVSTDASRMAFRIAPGSMAGQSAIADVLRVMELRLAVEVEAAALAAERATARQLTRIKRALQAIDTGIAAGDTVVQEDFAFHFAIAEATSNAHFPEFLSFIGRHVIPRQVVRASQETLKQRRSYLVAIQEDHVRIYDAIRTRDIAGARKAMRNHLSKSIARYRRMAVATR